MAFLARAALILVLVPISLVYALIHRLRPSPRVGARLEIRRVRAGEADLGELMQQREPVVLVGLAASLELERPLDLASLRARASSVTERFPVRHYKASSPYFLYTGDYGLELDHTSQLSLEEFIETLFDRGVPEGQCVYQHFDRKSLNGEAGAVIQAVADAIAPIAGRAPETSASGIWIGSEGVVTPLHYDAWPGLLFQIHGAKRVWLFPPRDAHNLYLSSQFTSGGRWSALPGRSGDAAPSEFPRFARATRYETRLDTGDVLYIPPFWAHEIEALEPNVSMPFRFVLERTDYLHPRCLRPMCELFQRQYLTR